MQMPSIHLIPRLACSIRVIRYDWSIMSTALASTALINSPTSKPKNTPAKALSLRFGVRTSNKKKKMANPTPLITTVHQLDEFSVLLNSIDEAFTTSTDMMMIMKKPLNNQSNITVTFQ